MRPRHWPRPRTRRLLEWTQSPRRGQRDRVGGTDMPHVRITVGDLKCIRQADRYGKDDVYWLSNLRQGPAVDDVHTRLGKLIFDNDYDTSLPEMVEVGAGETVRFA